jgi:uncharacterized protein (TIGR03435 family)
MRLAAPTLFILLAGAGFAQIPATPAFEVASIKPSDPAARIAIRRSGHQLVTTGTSLEFLITWAYDVHSERLQNKPNWLDAARYDVIANAPQGPLPAQPGEPGPFQKMMQALLAERFKLALHRETRQMPVYALVVAKDSPRVKLGPAPESMGQNPFQMPGRGRLNGTQVSAAMLANVLSGQLGRTVRDETGLAGVFDFHLEWTPDTTTDAVGSGPSLFTALQEQLGLRLLARKGAGEVLVIDHVERTPAEN